MNVNIPVLAIFVEATIYLSYKLHECTFKAKELLERMKQKSKHGTRGISL